VDPSLYGYAAAAVAYARFFAYGPSLSVSNDGV